MTVECTCEDCKHWENNGCKRDEIKIDDNTLTGGGYLPMCADYEEGSNE